MTKIDSHLIHHARGDAVTALAAYIGAMFLLVFAIGSGNVVALVVLTPVAALLMLGTTALVLELVRVAPHVEG